MLMKVTAVEQAPSDELANDPQLQRLAGSAGDDMLDQMVNSLKDRYGVSINQTVLDQSASTVQ
jgi:peptidyl-prolyl cis-trans isomerase D